MEEVSAETATKLPKYILPMTQKCNNLVVVNQCAYQLLLFVVGITSAYTYLLSSKSLS